ncbi:MAG TPA: efflux RND transporter periplasmic adaptor subunit [Thermoanaerobaculia bacterium]|nr:efflux RND transporter periplasmic adaptor subunit [Thermoanaerobaculia bacterium]
MRSALCIVLAFACHKPTPPPAIPTVNIESQSVAVASIRYVASGPRVSGTLQAERSATIVSQSSGTVTAVYAHEGQAVAPGSVLARIEDPTATENVQSASTTVQSATTALAMAERDRERTTRLAHAGALPKRDIEVARSQVAGAQAQLGQAQNALANARNRLGNQTVTASTRGVVIEKKVSEGDVVAPGAPLFTVVDLSTLQLEAGVNTSAIGDLRAGTSVVVKVHGYEQENFRGTVTRISPAVDPATGQVRVYVSIANPGHLLISGLFAEGTITSASRQALAVPIDALDESGDTPSVVRVRNGVAERVTVQTGLRNEAEGYVEITSGLQPGDRVLFGPARTITPGTRVNVGTA